ncbi:uncharacterized protein LOC130939727 [Arachis stenosperma]|uniref:uncharacterized protein LOC130939727 n=1 Tax=Arachis stenosperma TaxID=217475 RepID=UPI0025AC0FDD|nr:uncharacterized protein LOC130939727 [Arachis stenosperma]
MSIDKSWIGKPRTTHEYKDGLNKFLDFTFEHRSLAGRQIKCPCPVCGFGKWQTREKVFEHLIVKPFPENYKVWYWHGEEVVGVGSQVHQTSHIVQDDSTSQHPMVTMLNDAFGVAGPDLNEDGDGDEDNIEDGDGDNAENEEHNGENVEFYMLLEDGNEQLYEGCTKYSKLSFLISLYHIKCLYRISDKAMTEILKLLKDAFGNAKISNTFYEAKKTINKLGLNYTKIPACPNDCMLYWGKDEDLQECKRCKTSKWSDAKKKKPAKILRYFPLKPRLQRLFMCSKTAQSIQWHALAEKKDSKMRHPRDSEAWKTFDLLHDRFVEDPRNVRLGLAADGFNPFGTMRTNYSIWPVVLIPYNRPQWECMKPTSLILSMIIPGEKMPGNNTDVYLQPLIKELKELWYDGVQTLDRFRNEMFTLRAALMWTISDFPGLGNLSGWNVHSKYACPTCNFSTDSYRLKHGGKWYFLGHRRFLERGHKFRLSHAKFNGKIELRDPPAVLTGSEILEQLEGINVSFGKELQESKGKRIQRKVVEEDDESGIWRKKSIFFYLPYWESNLLRHNLDVMHIEKNVCDNVLYTLLNETGRSKDNLKARKDLKEMGIRKDLWPDENRRYHPSLFTMSNSMKDIFLRTIKNIRVPDGLSSNISRCVDLKQRKLSGLKSHDCHVLMQQLLPIAIRNVLPDKVTAVLIELSSFFQQLCSKSLSLIELEKLQPRIILTLCHLEMLFPPSFFTIMVHLTCHLVDEAKLGGPVHYRWMYPIERYLGHLKSYVRNKAKSEGSIAKGYVAKEALTFCSRYLEGIETRFNRPPRVDDRSDDNYSTHVDSLFPQMGNSKGAFTLMNPDIMNTVHEDLRYLARGPSRYAKRFSTFSINGFSFRTTNRDKGLKTQNSGVFLMSSTPCVASASDADVRNGDLSYYGKLEDIIELNYNGRFRVTLFKCKWADTTRERGCRKDNWGFTSINFSRVIHSGDREEDDPYIEVSQARMVYFVNDEVNKDWSVVVHLKPKDSYDMGGNEDDEPCENEPWSEQNLDSLFENGDNLSLLRDEVDDELLDNNIGEDEHMSE